MYKMLAETFSKLKDYTINNSRKTLQLIMFIYVLGIGLRFYYYYMSLLAGNLNVTKPAGIEAFLPLSAVLGLKQLLYTGMYDPLHPAALTIFLSILIISAVFKKSFCGYLCPFGFVLEYISENGLKLKMPKILHYPLLCVKYYLPFGFLKTVFYSMQVRDVQMFLFSSYNKISDAKMLELLLYPTLKTLIIATIIVFLSFLFRGFFCKYLCPYGALLGILSFLSPFKIRRNEEACIQCKLCAKACPMDIEVYKKKKVYTPECISCQQCINAVPKRNCLNNMTKTRSINSLNYTFLVFSLFMALFFIALITGNIHSIITNAEYLELLKRVDSIGP